MHTRRKTISRENNTSNTTRITRNNPTKDNNPNNNPKFPRVLKKNNTIPDKKVSDLITSSVKKQKNVRVFSKKNVNEENTNLNNRFDSIEEDSNRDVNMDNMKTDDLNDREAIFSPTFHLHKENGSDIHDKVMEAAQEESSTVPDAMMTSSSSLDDFSGLGNLSSEVSAIYFAMQQNRDSNSGKLECLDEQNRDSNSSDEMEEVEEGDQEENDEFDPFVFIKELPDLSVVVPRFRKVLLPKQTRSCPDTTLVLDLDETLVHSTLEPIDSADFTFQVNFNLKNHVIYVKCRPYLSEFLQRVALLFETIIFTASQSIYAEQLLNVLDPKRKIFRHRVYRDSCVYVEGNYLKDLSVLGRDLSRVIIVDNSPQAFGFQIDNGVPIESWFDDPNDKELLLLLPFLESLAGVQDVRPLITRKFNLRQKVASANSLSIDFKSMI